MTSPQSEQFGSQRAPGKRRRWLLGIEPIFEAGVTGERAAAWDVEDELMAVAFLGDVTIDLSRANLAGREIAVSAWAIVRDVEIIVSPETRVELSGSVVWGDVTSKIPPAGAAADGPMVRIHGHALFGDVDVHLAD